MNTAIRLDFDAIAQLCAKRGVARLRVFGSVVSDRFDPATSDIDFVVDFLPDRRDLFDDYFGLREDLSALFHREVDLVIGRTIKNPYFRRAVLETAQDVYAA